LGVKEIANFEELQDEFVKVCQWLESAVEVQDFDDDDIRVLEKKGERLIEIAKRLRAINEGA